MTAKTYNLAVLSALALATVTVVAQSSPSGRGGGANPEYDAKLNGKVLTFAKLNVGKQVGDGQCWTLADQALKFAGARRPGSGGLGIFQFGTAIANGKNPPTSLMRPGDIVQFEEVKFEDGNSWFEFPKHTAIVQSVQGTKVTLLHQNLGNQKTVQSTTLDFSKLTKGTYYAFHAEAP